MAGTPPNPSTAAATEQASDGPAGRGSGHVTSLTVAGGRRRDHYAQVRRGAGAGDDGRAEQSRGRQLAARTQPQHLEVAHLAGDAVPLAPPCVPRGATLLAMAGGHVAVRQVRPRGAERDGG